MRPCLHARLPVGDLILVRYTAKVRSVREHVEYLEDFLDYHGGYQHGEARRAAEGQCEEDGEERGAASGLSH
jgi:hypothetical protein